MQVTKSFPCGKTHGHCSIVEKYGICVEAVMGCCALYNLKKWKLKNEDERLENEAERLVKKYFPNFEYEKEYVTNEILNEIIEGEKQCK